MFKIILLAIIIISISFPAFSQKENNRKLIIVTFDGYRWKDIFRGADSALLFAAEKGKKDSAEFINRCWENNTIERREKLMPFFWKTFGGKGRRLRSDMVCSNKPLHFTVR